MSLRIAIYTRISRDAEEEGLGVARQERDCRERAAREGWEVAGVFADNDVSASTKSTSPRPKYAAMLAAARAGQIQGILAYSNSRLTRRPRELEDLIDLHDQFGTRFATVVSGDDDLSTADGRMVARIRSNIDAGEAERTSERVQRKMRELAESGRYVGPRPFGWDAVGAGPQRCLAINPTEHRALLETVELLLQHGGVGDGSVWQLTKRLNGAGIKTATGGLWVTQVLRRTLMREMNFGMRRHEPGRKTGKAGKATLYPGQWEPLWDKETHERIVALLTDPSRKTNNRGTDPVYLLTSIAHCGACEGFLVGTKGYTYFTKSTGRTRTYYPSYYCPKPTCHGISRRMDVVDYAVTETVLGVLERDGVELLGGDPTAASEAAVRIQEIEAKLSLAADQFADDLLTGEQLARITARLRPELAAAKGRLASAQPASLHREFAGAGVREAWAEASLEVRKALLRALGITITVHRIGVGNGKKHDPDAVTVVWPARVG